MTLPDTAPALTALALPEVRGSLFPEPLRTRLAERSKRRLGEPFGLSQFGVNLVELAPGSPSALRHWHLLEDEFVYVLEGELTLVTDRGETLLRAGDCAGFAGGRGDAHLLINRSSSPARYLEVGSRCPGDVAFYPDDDVMWVTRDEGGQAVETVVHKDGRPY